MSKIEQYSRIIHHRTTIAGQSFTIPTSNDHTDDTWLNSDLYIGELGINVSDDRIFMRTNNGIIQIATGTSSGGTSSSTTNIWSFSSPNIVIGSTYSADSVSPRSGQYTDLGTSTLRWKDLYLAGSANGRSTINVNAGVLLTEASSQGILSSGYDSNDNSPIQIYGTSSVVLKSRPIHINSYSSYISPGNQKVSIASKSITDNSTSDSFVSGQNVTINTGLTSSVHLGYGYGRTNYNSKEVVVGNLAVRGIPDDGSGQYTKSDWITRQASLRTSNALSTTIATVDTWADDGTAIQVKAYVMGVSIQDASLVYSAELMGCFYGGASYTSGEVGTQVTNNISSWSGTQPDVSMSSDVNGIYIKVVGRGSDTIQWLVTYSYHKLINLVP